MSSWSITNDEAKAYVTATMRSWLITGSIHTGCEQAPHMEDGELVSKVVALTANNETYHWTVWKVPCPVTGQPICYGEC